MNQQQLPGLHLARKSDPSTSAEAATSLDLGLNEKTEKICEWVRVNGPASDDQIADAMVTSGAFARHEQARRAIRTAREEHGLLVPHLDKDGNQAETVNQSGRRAKLWEHK